MSKEVHILSHRFFHGGTEPPGKPPSKCCSMADAFKNLVERTLRTNSQLGQSIEGFLRVNLFAMGKKLKEWLTVGQW